MTTFSGSFTVKLLNLHCFVVLLLFFVLVCLFVFLTLVNACFDFFLIGDGTIDFLEFLEVMASRMGENSFEDDMREAFQMFDRDCNGYISKRELKFVMISLGEQITEAAVENMMKEVDLDGDGRVNYEGE